MIRVPNPKILVADIRKAQAEQGLSINDIISLMKEKGEYPVAQATISRVLSGDAEDANYDYLKTLIPLYNTLVKETTDNDEKIRMMELLLEYKLECIKDLKEQLEQKDEEHKAEIDHLKVKYHEKMEKETAKFQEIMEFRSRQIELKDDRITKLLDINGELTTHIVNCPYRGKC